MLTPDKQRDRIQSHPSPWLWLRCLGWWDGEWQWSQGSSWTAIRFLTSVHSWSWVCFGDGAVVTTTVETALVEPDTVPCWRWEAGTVWIRTCLKWKGKNPTHVKNNLVTLHSRHALKHIICFCCQQTFTSMNKTKHQNASRTEYVTGTSLHPLFMWDGRKRFQG